METYSNAVSLLNTCTTSNLFCRYLFTIYSLQFEVTIIHLEVLESPFMSLGYRIPLVSIFKTDVSNIIFLDAVVRSFFRPVFKELSTFYNAKREVPAKYLKASFSTVHTTH